MPLWGTLPSHPAQERSLRSRESQGRVRSGTRPAPYFHLPNLFPHSLSSKMLELANQKEKEKKSHFAIYQTGVSPVCSVCNKAFDSKQHPPRSYVWPNHLRLHNGARNTAAWLVQALPSFLILKALLPTSDFLGCRYFKTSPYEPGQKPEQSRPWKNWNIVS